jgi:hypothetical protein
MCAGALTLAAIGAARADRVILEPGTVIPVRLNDKLSSKTSAPGDTFSATVREGDRWSDYGPLPVGTRILGVVDMARPRSGDEPGALRLQFTQFRLPNGKTYPMVGRLIALDDHSVIRTRDGRLVAKPTRSNEPLTYMGYGAGAGFVLGAITGRPVRGTIVGGAIGGLIGAIAGSHPRVHDVVLNPGTQMGVVLTRRASYSANGSYEYPDKSPLREDQTGSGNGPGGYLVPDNSPQDNGPPAHP